ncbi:CCA tRNA nucleotidyltransferase [Antarcticirhabdus aurantiaca]|uniref:CCA tRNA nucleotidyltransferase n=1 Tax=Antarcticirhabdus aurantiaca TaxID=2606717 RepID=A0ACD4NT59_9HYPH|nr:CCA tRNA nucleotidyltransferase [Antarcticirhabdus aurantiaca]WAJ30051.1 CCA tRNA nucleotidyltransferase [Jeongeuplla avenae]
MTSPTRIDADWLRAEPLQRLLSALSENGEEARVAGGAVRNALMKRDATDIDVATTVLPQETIRRAEAAGFRAVPTGIEHGTITVVTPGGPFEVTTLREDIETDGRRAVVRFGRDWKRDAERRDFTINALYADKDGAVLDLVGGIKDIEAGVLRFVGDPETRIREDYLRTLRFFRFFAWYGSGRPDAAGLRASARLKDGLSRLSAERVWMELRKLLAAPDPSRALLWMRQAGVLTAVLPESEKWGIDAIHLLTQAEAALGWPADALLRLQAIVPPDPERMVAMAGRLKLSNAERDRLLAWTQADKPDPAMADGALRARLFFGDRQAILDRLRLALASARGRAAGGAPDALAEAAALSRQLDIASRFDPPAFPVSGSDVVAAGTPAGPEVGRAIDRLKRLWVDGGFVMSREDLLARL